ncbi:hypothetical protein ACP4OV_020931 [Aristida adscensionis]
MAGNRITRVVAPIMVLALIFLSSDAEAKALNCSTASCSSSNNQACKTCCIEDGFAAGGCHVDDAGIVRCMCNKSLPRGEHGGRLVAGEARRI